MGEAEESQLPRARTIFDLGYYNLYEIMSYLSLNEKLQLGLLDCRFQEHLERFLRNDRFQMLEVVAGFGKNETKHIFQRYGSMIKRLNLELTLNFYDSNFYYELLSTYCEDLLELRFKFSVEITASFLIQLLEKSMTLVRLKIFDWPSRNEALSESVAAKISTLSNLTKLSLHRSLTTGKYLGNLTNLKHFDARKCSELKPEYFIEICKANKLLTLLCSGCKKLDNAAFQTLVETQTELHSIAVGGDYVATNVEIVADLAMVKTFRIDPSDPSKALQCLKKLALVKHQSLECIFASNILKSELYTCNPSHEKIATSIVSSLAQFKKLKNLHLPRNSFLNCERLQQILKVCKELEVLNIANSKWIDGEKILDTVKDLKNLHVLNMSGCGWSEFATYSKLYTIVKGRNTFKLTVYGMHFAGWGQFMNTMEYKIRSRCIEIKTDDGWDFSKASHTKREVLRLQSYNSGPAADVSWNGPSLLDLPDNIVENVISLLDPVDKLKIALLHSRFHTLVTKSLANDTVNLNEFVRFFSFDDTRNVLRICSKNMKKINFSYRRGEKPLHYVNILKSYKTNFVVLNTQTLLSSDGRSQQIIINNYCKLLSIP